MKKVIYLCLIVALATSSLFAAGVQETSEVKEVVVYASVDEANAKSILDAFTADTGIKAAFVHLSSGPAYSRIKAEENNPQADVWLGAPNENHILAKNEGLTVAYKSAALDKLAPEFKDPDGYWRSFYMNPMAFGVNTEALAKVGAPIPTSWNDLLDPVYKGLIQSPTPQASGTAYNVITSLTQAWGEDEAYAYMAKLNANIQTYTSSGTGPSKGVAVGQCAIGIQFTPAFFQFIAEEYPLEVVFPSEGVGFEAPALSIIKGAKNLESAQILADWLVSKAGQDVLSEANTYFYPVNPEAELAPGMPEFSTLKTIAVSSEWAGANKERLVERWVNEVLAAK